MTVLDRAESTSQRRGRNISLDVYKGFLVLAMIVYHAAYVTSSSAGHGVPVVQIKLRLTFLHYAFIFMSGYLCGYHYVPLTLISYRKVAWRLTKRSLKLFGILLVACVLVYSLRIGGYSLENLSKQVGHVSDVPRCLMTLKDNLVPYEILYYIAAFLLVSPVCLKPFPALVFCALMAIGSQFAGFRMCAFLCVALIGLLVGTLHERGKCGGAGSIVRPPRSLFVLVIFVALWVISPKLDTVLRSGHWGVLIPLWRSFEVVLWGSALISILHVVACKWLMGTLAIIGQYTLLGYVVQMPLIRMAAGVTKMIGFTGPIMYVVNVVGLAIVLSALLLLFDYARRNRVFVDRSYRLVFS
jgi:hypothetical protein